MGRGFDEDIAVAAVEVIGRSGAREFEVGYLDDDVPSEFARWWARAQYSGARIQVENHQGPDLAAEALARRILNGGQCTHCGARIHLGGVPAALRRRGRVCSWKREGRRWVRGCVDRVPEGRRVVEKPGWM